MKWDGNRVIDLNRAREMVLEAVADDRARFTMTVCEMHREEHVQVRVDYEVCGVHMDRDCGMLKLMVNINGMSPTQVSVDRSRFQDKLNLAVAEKFPFLIKDTYCVSLDMGSVSGVNLEGELAQFREEMEYAIQAHGFRLDDVLPAIMVFVRDSLPESSYDSVEDITEGRKGREGPNGSVVDITPPGIPCPHCSGLLSEEALRELMMRYHMRFRHGRERFDQ